jgi:predicted NUDIX family NTP pyrophosphohydrolase
LAKTSAGILLYRRSEGFVEVLLVHPGGPFWKKRDAGSWSIPKGECGPNEEPLGVAKREFEEETSFKVDGEFHSLKPLKQPGGKIVYAWLLEGDLDASSIKSNMFSMEWPPRSGKEQEFPEVDRADWFKIDRAKEKILKGQVGFLDQLLEILGENAVSVDHKIE